MRTTGKWYNLIVTESFCQVYIPVRQGALRFIGTDIDQLWDCVEGWDDTPGACNAVPASIKVQQA